MLVTVILLKSVTALPESDCVEVPLKTTVPVPRLNVPPLVKFPATLSVAGAFSIPVMPMLAKLVVVPAILVVPVKVIVPPPLLNVPLLVQVPATLTFPEGAVKVFVLPMVRLLNVHTLVPEIVVVPPNVTVPALAFRVPLFTKFPLTLKLAEGVNVPVLVTVTVPKVGVVAPLNAVVPEKVIALAVSTEVELLTKFPFRSTAFAFVSNVPALSVSVPVSAVVPSRVFVFVPKIVTLLNV